ncbi:MAG: preprotein translocase subunit SecY [Thermoprotei archaeon]|nr:MAG: preprotein translocase subunit SecY [Thermoprotei archaeon]RLE82725.1 MAG: preprotein translocase subunit SecY [Thermoprotei archaeon]RLF03575.1 MAG: preprotein translocase subunit SecY [Thermoprotei archaeon]
MKRVGLLDAVDPVLRVLPEIPKPPRRLPLSERLAWTGIVLVLYLIMSQIPLYGIPWQERGLETFQLIRIITASKRGTLMELGIGPLVTSGLIWQLLVGSKLINLDLTTPRGRGLFTGLQKLFAIIFTFIEAAAFILGGYYGPLAFEQSSLVFTQLSIATILVLLMDEMLQKGWGLGSGVSLFIAAGVSQQIFWQLFSPISVGDELPLGVIPACVVALGESITSNDWSKITYLLTRRPEYPSLLGFITMLAFFALLLYLENMQIEIPIGVSKYGGMRTKIPLKFLYVSNIPIILVSALLANLHIFSRILWTRFSTESGHWLYQYFLKYIADYNATGGRLVPVKGTLTYYLSPPGGINSLIEDPVQVLIYAGFVILFSILFSIAWIETSGMDPWSQAQQLSEAGMYIPGFRKAPRILASVLSKYIPTLAVLSGLIVALIAVISDLVGVLGTGIGVLLLVGILIQYQAIIAQERALEMYPILRRLVGTR